MTGNVALDVVIGLVFIFLLYSLLASILAEIVASTLGLRARNLHKAISRMLEHDYPEYFQTKTTGTRRFFAKPLDLINDIVESIKRFFNISVPRSTKKFYEHPLVKYASSDKFNSKPSYLSRQDFSKIVMDLLKDDKEGSDLEKIQRSIKQFETNSTKILELEERIEESKSMENKKDRKEIRKKLRIELEQLEEKTFITKDTLSLFKSFLSDSQNDLDKFKLKLEVWFDSTMDRAKGWYKRKNQLVLMIIGFGIALTFNVNSIEITQKLIKDDEARAQLVNMATTYIEKNGGNNANPNPTENRPGSGTNPNAYLDSISKLKEEIEKEIKNTDEILGYQFDERLKADTIYKQANCSLEPSENQIILKRWFTEHVVEFKDSKTANKAMHLYRIKNRSLEKDNGEYYVYLSWTKQLRHFFFGYFITALGISLGANFWFDLLNKLVKLRSSSQIETQQDETKKTEQTKKYVG